MQQVHYNTNSFVKICKHRFEIIPLCINQKSSKTTELLNSAWKAVFSSGRLLYCSIIGLRCKTRQVHHLFHVVIHWYNHYNQINHNGFSQWFSFILSRTECKSNFICAICCFVGEGSDIVWHQHPGGETWYAKSTCFIHYPFSINFHSCRRKRWEWGGGHKLLF